MLQKTNKLSTISQNIICFDNFAFPKRDNIIIKPKLKTHKKQNKTPIPETSRESNSNKQKIVNQTQVT